MNNVIFFVVCGLSGLFIIASLLRAIRTSYQIDRLKTHVTSTTRFTNVFGHALGFGLPPTLEVHPLKRRLRIQVAFMALGFIVLIGAILLQSSG